MIAIRRATPADRAPGAEICLLASGPMVEDLIDLDLGRARSVPRYVFAQTDKSFSRDQAPVAEEGNQSAGLLHGFAARATGHLVWALLRSLRGLLQVIRMRHMLPLVQGLPQSVTPTLREHHRDCLLADSAAVF